jgi:protease-4
MADNPTPSDFSSGPPPPEPSGVPVPPSPTFRPVPPGTGGASVPATPRKRSVLAIVFGILLVGSIILNAVMGLFCLLVLVGGSAGEESLVERTVGKGAATHKIAVIRIQGVISEEMAERLHTQFERAAGDASVKAVILRINSPGGGLTASDTIYHDIKTLLDGKPVVAAMGGVAASGGYYIACSAKEIVAQRTTITGSIGVVAQFFFVGGLLKDKLGVVPVTLTKGKRKDWPNIFTGIEMTEEQRTYLDESLMEPGYQQFVDIVAEGRGMTREKALRLATGEIYLGQKAKELGLVDAVGYFDDAVAETKKLAGLKDARVVEYAQPFSLAGLLGVESKTPAILDLTPEKLSNMASPKLMYLWTGE